MNIFQEQDKTFFDKALIYCQGISMSEQSNIERVSEEIVDFIKNGSSADNNAEAYTVTDWGKSGTLVFGNYRYTRWGDEVSAGNEELYNHSANPGELENLVNDAFINTWKT